jgi:hypothetical protein
VVQGATSGVQKVTPNAGLLKSQSAAGVSHWRERPLVSKEALWDAIGQLTSLTHTAIKLRIPCAEMQSSYNCPCQFNPNEVIPIYVAVDRRYDLRQDSAALAIS